MIRSLLQDVKTILNEMKPSEKVTFFKVTLIEESPKYNMRFFPHACYKCMKSVPMSCSICHLFILSCLAPECKSLLLFPDVIL